MSIWDWIGPTNFGSGKARGWSHLPSVPTESKLYRQPDFGAALKIGMLVHGPGATEALAGDRGSAGNSAVVACLAAITTAYPEAPLKVWSLKGDERTELPDSPFALRLASLNPFMPPEVIWAYVQWCKRVDGNAYLRKIRAGNAETGNVVELWPISPARIEVVTTKGSGDFISFYRFHISPGVHDDISPQNMVHFRMGLDDRDHRLGLAPLKALAREISTDEHASQFSDALLGNFAVPGLVAQMPSGVQLTVESAEEIKAKLSARFSGGNQGSVAVIDDGATLTTVGWSPKDLDLKDLHRLPEERISAVLQVPAAVAGLGSGIDATKVGAPQPLSARVWTPYGPTTMGALAVGDTIAIPSGWGQVEAVYPQGEQDIYRVTFQDGSTAESTLDHAWQVNTPRQGWRPVPLGEIASWSFGKLRRTTVPLQGITEFEEQAVLLPPYVLGLLIADGTFRGNLAFSNANRQIVTTIQEQVGSAYAVNQTAPGISDYRIAYRAASGGRGIGGGTGALNPFISELRRLGLWMLTSPEKFIPDRYKYNSVAVRRQVLQGILDGDGFVNLHGQPAIDQSSPRLADDITEIVQSLGGYTLRATKRANLNTRLINGRAMASRHDLVRLSIVIDDASTLFECDEKRDRCRMRKKAATRKMRAIEFVRREQAQCIKVEGGLYLTDHFIVTHNTMRELREMFTETCLVPSWRSDAAVINTQLKPDFSSDPAVLAEFDTTAVAALQDDENAKAIRVDTLVRGGQWTIDEGRSEMGMEALPDGAGAVLLIPGAWAPTPVSHLTALANAPAPDPTAPALPVPTPLRALPAPAKARGVGETKALTNAEILARYEAGLAPLQESLSADLVDAFDEVVDAACGRLGSVLKSRVIKASEPLAIPGLVTEADHTEIRSLLRSAVLKAARSSAEALAPLTDGKPMRITRATPAVKQAIAAMEARIPGIVETTSDDFGRLVRRLERRPGSVPIADVQAALRSYVNDTYVGRSAAIARTELGYGQLAGSLHVIQRAGLSQRVTIHDGDTDEVCADRNGDEMSIEEAQSLSLAHPNCTLAISPIMGAA